jgi:phospholipid/cholesterol/gamma-HCH transport system permease protein
MRDPRLLKFTARVRERADAAFLYVGNLTDLAVQTVQQFRRGPVERPLLVAQFDQIGVRSLSIVIITSAFIGMVLALQTAYALADFGGKMFVGTIVSLSLVRELAPVLMSLMVGGRVGAGIAAELGTMKVTEQIDALRALATNPANAYLRSVIEAVHYNDLASGIGKTFFFGFSIALIACFNGLRTSGGADGVGRSTTQTVVTGSITVLIMDFFLTKLFLFFF